MADHASVEQMSDLVEVGPAGMLAAAEQRALVLAAVGIESRLVSDGVVVRL